MSGDSNPIDLLIVDAVTVAKAAFRANEKLRHRQRVENAQEIRDTDFSGQYGGLYMADLQISLDLDAEDAATADDGSSCVIDYAGNRFKQIAAGSGTGADAAGSFAGRSTYDAEPKGFFYLSMDGDGGSVTDAVMFVKLSATSGDWSSAILLRGPRGGDRYEIGNWDSDRPASGEELLSWIVTTGITLPAGLVGSVAKARVASTGTAVYSIQKNDVQIGTLTFTASATGVFAMASQQTLVAGDRLSMIAPNPRDATLSGVVTTLVATR